MNEFTQQTGDPEFEYSPERVANDNTRSLRDRCGG